MRLGANFKVNMRTLIERDGTLAHSRDLGADVKGLFDPVEKLPSGDLHMEGFENIGNNARWAFRTLTRLKEQDVLSFADPETGFINLFRIEKVTACWEQGAVVCYTAILLEKV